MQTHLLCFMQIKNCTLSQSRVSFVVISSVLYLALGRWDFLISGGNINPQDPQPWRHPFLEPLLSCRIFFHSSKELCWLLCTFVCWLDSSSPLRHYPGKNSISANNNPKNVPWPSYMYVVHSRSHSLEKTRFLACRVPVFFSKWTQNILMSKSWTVIWTFQPENTAAY